MVEMHALRKYDYDPNQSMIFEISFQKHNTIL